MSDVPVRIKAVFVEFASRMPPIQSAAVIMYELVPVSVRVSIEHVMVSMLPAVFTTVRWPFPKMHVFDCVAFVLYPRQVTLVRDCMLAAVPALHPKHTI